AHPELVFVGNVVGTVEQLPSSSHGHTRALCWERSVHGQGARGLVTTQRMGGGMSAGAPAVVAQSGAFGIVLNAEPARLMSLVFARDTGETVRRCFDTRAIEKDR